MGNLIVVIGEGAFVPSSANGVLNVSITSKGTDAGGASTELIFLVCALTFKMSYCCINNFSSDYSYTSKCTIRTRGGVVTCATTDAW